MGGAVSNWIQAGSGGATIYGGSGNDWLYGGAGTNMIYGGSGTEMIYGGSGNNTLVGGTGLDDIYGGSGTNWIYGNGQNDRLWGGSGNNYIDPRGGTGLATVEVEDHNGLPTFDGNIDASGNSDNGDYEAIADPGYGGQVANWDFSGFDSGVRLGEDATTPMAVYANWQSTASPSPGTQWVDNAVYVVMDGSTILGTVTVDQTSSPGNGSPESADRPWKLLGVWNVPAGDTIEVILKSGDIGSANPGDMLCAGDVMVHAIWPTVTIRTNANGDGILDTKDDWVDSFQPIQMAVEGTGTRTELQLQTSIEMLYFSISSAIATEALPSVSGLTFWSSEQTTTPLTPDSNGNIIDQSLSSSDYTNTSTLYCSFPANSNDSSVQIQLAFQSASGKALSVLRGANNAQRNDFYVSLFKSPAKRNPDGSSELIVKSPTINPSLMGGNAVDTSAQYQLHFAAGRPNEAVQTVTCTGSLTLNLVVPNGAAAAPPMTLTLAWNEVYAEMWTTSSSNVATRTDIHTMAISIAAQVFDSAYNCTIVTGTGSDKNKLFIQFNKKAYNGARFEISSWDFTSNVVFRIVNENANFAIPAVQAGTGTYPAQFMYNSPTTTWTPVIPNVKSQPNYIGPGRGTNMSALKPPIDLTAANNFSNVGVSLTCTDTRTANWKNTDPSPPVVTFKTTGYK
jgi:hypothetical protein